MRAVALGSTAIKFQKHVQLKHVDLCTTSNEATWKTKGNLKSLRSVVRENKNVAGIKALVTLAIALIFEETYYAIHLPRSFHESCLTISVGDAPWVV